MKKSLLILSISCLLVLTSFAQTIRRVNNTPGLNDPNVYATAQAAHDAAAPNDIISLEPSASPSYGGLTATKRINIVGPGYYLDKNPNNFFDKRNPYLTQIVFAAGSANSTAMGIYSGGVFSITDVNVTVSRCNVSGIVLGGSGVYVGGVLAMGNNATITNNILTGSGIQAGSGGGYNCVISNNIIAGGSISNLNSAIINYNTMNGSFSGVIGSTVTNNIFDARSQPISYQVLPANNSGTTASNNICLGVNGLPIGGGNVNGANPNIVFIGTSDPFTTYFGATNGDKDFQLAVGSPALTAAAGGTQAGAFGNGSNAYRLSGVPNTPIVTSFISTGSGNNTTPLSITVSVRSNN